MGIETGLLARLAFSIILKSNNKALVIDSEPLFSYVNRQQPDLSDFLVSWKLPPRETAT